MICVYLITNNVNGRKYIGITNAKTPARRWRDHKSAANRGEPWLLPSAIRKYGARSFTVDHIASSTSWQDACEVERILIRDYETFFENGGGYNMTRGGDGMLGRKQSPETIAKRKRPGRKMSEEAKRLIGLASKGRSVGLVRSPETRMKIRLSKLGKKLTPEHASNAGATHRIYGPGSRCSIPLCDRQPVARGMCKNHYIQKYFPRHTYRRAAR